MIAIVIGTIELVISIFDSSIDSDWLGLSIVISLVIDQYYRDSYIVSG